MAIISIVHHSGYGHTRRMAEYVQTGVTDTGATAHFLAIDEHGDLPADAWDTLVASHGILFGAPTYMGGPSWQFKNSRTPAANPGSAKLGKTSSPAASQTPLP